MRPGDAAACGCIHGVIEDGFVALPAPEFAPRRNERRATE
jgi:hypothetical protein